MQKINGPQKSQHPRLISFAIFLAVLFLFQQNAYAYLDPGSGSLFIQIIIAALVAIPLVFKTFWLKLTSFFKWKRKKGDKPKKNPDKKA